ncbi:MAG: hypothetical protein HC871_07325 [Rhizobiales bacterium]|nr:hypothetical protein [Hyphomicrobiales bacterium]
MPKTLRLAATLIEELDQPRPHYRVAIRGAVTTITGTADPTAGLLPDEIVMTVRLPAHVGSDLGVIREAARQRALTLLQKLIDMEEAPPDRASYRAAVPVDSLDAGVG